MSSIPVCRACRDADALPMQITMAFQPIVAVSSRVVFAHEALVRGTHGESAGQVLAQVTADNRYAFDQACRIRAIEQAAALSLPALLSINFMPNAVYIPAHCLRATLAAATRHDWPLSSILFEVTEQEVMRDPAHLLDILRTYRDVGLKTAIDDFGAGYSGLNLLADFSPDLLKLDMHLVRGIDQDRKRQAIARHGAALAQELGITVIAEGIETADESHALQDLGIDLQQGYLFARPQLDGLAPIHWPA
jgi:EAL domain-containing protein (putative c-di-GMP-specific phosphodiesterase class I)